MQLLGIYSPRSYKVNLRMLVESLVFVLLCCFSDSLPRCTLSYILVPWDDIYLLFETGQGLAL